MLNFDNILNFSLLHKSQVTFTKNPQFVKSNFLAEKLDISFISLYGLKWYFCELGKENRIYIRGEFTRKSVKRPFCCTVSILQVYIFMLYNLLGSGISFYRKSKINVKRKPNYEIGWFHN